MPVREFADFMLASIAALFPVIDPIGSVPIFLVLTAGVPESLRRTYARRIALNVIFLLVGFLLVGGTLLRFFWGFARGGADCGWDRGVPCGVEYDERGVEGE